VGLSGWDAEKAVKAQFGKHARVVNIDSPSRAQMNAEKGNKRHMSEEVKRSTDEIMGGAKTTDRLRAFSGAVVESGAWFLNVGQLFDNRKGSSDRTGKIAGGGKWTNDPDVSKWVAHECDSCGGKFLRDPDWAERQVWMCKPCRHENGFFTTDADRIEFGKGKRNIKGNTSKRLGGMEFANEDLGTNIEAHGDPAMVADFQRRGLLRKRLDAMGFPVTNLVTGSRKEQERIHQEFNRRQKEAQDRGWVGTRSASGVKVHFLNHGGNTPGD
jgi:hypothetical protein